MILKHIAAPPGTGLGPRSVCSGASHTVACSPTRQVSPLPPPRPLGPAAAAPAGSPRSLGRRRQAWLSHRVGQPKCKGISHEYVPRVTRSQHRANPVPPVKKNCSEPAADSADSADSAGGAGGADGAFHSRARHRGRPGGAGGPRGCCVQNREESQRSPQQNWTPQARNSEVGTVTPPEQAYCPGPCWSHSRASEWGGGRGAACEKQMPAAPQSTGLSRSAGVQGPGTLHF